MPNTVYLAPRLFLVSLPIRPFTVYLEPRRFTVYL